MNSPMLSYITLLGKKQGKKEGASFSTNKLGEAMLCPCNCVGISSINSAILDNKYRARRQLLWDLKRGWVCEGDGVSVCPTRAELVRWDVMSCQHGIFVSVIYAFRHRFVDTLVKTSCILLTLLCVWNGEKWEGFFVFLIYLNHQRLSDPVQTFKFKGFGSHVKQ